MTTVTHQSTEGVPSPTPSELRMASEMAADIEDMTIESDTEPGSRAEGQPPTRRRVSASRSPPQSQGLETMMREAFTKLLREAGINPSNTGSSNSSGSRTPAPPVPLFDAVRSVAPSAPAIDGKEEKRDTGDIETGAHAGSETPHIPSAGELSHAFAGVPSFNCSVCMNTVRFSDRIVHCPQVKTRLRASQLPGIVAHALHERCAWAHNNSIQGLGANSPGYYCPGCRTKFPGGGFLEVDRTPVPEAAEALSLLQSPLAAEAGLITGCPTIFELQGIEPIEVDGKTYDKMLTTPDILSARDSYIHETRKDWLKARDTALKRNSQMSKRLDHIAHLNYAARLQEPERSAGPQRGARAHARGARAAATPYGDT